MLEPENRAQHAAEIVGLAISSESGPVWVNAYGPICFSGQYLMLGEQRQTVCTWLRTTEKVTGWNISFIITRLKQKWEASDAQLVS
jgi:hypothetical protein